MGTALGILATCTRRFLASGSLGAGTKRPLFDGSFLGNLGAFQELAFAASGSSQTDRELLQAPNKKEAAKANSQKAPKFPRKLP